MPHGEWPESKNIPAPGLGDWLDVFTRVGNTKDKQFWERRLFRFRVHRRALLLSRFSRVRLCATPETAAHQAPPSLGFSRQEHWSGLPLPSPMQESEK